MYFVRRTQNGSVTATPGRMQRHEWRLTTAVSTVKIISNAGDNTGGLGAKRANGATGRRGVRDVGITGVRHRGPRPVRRHRGCRAGRIRVLRRGRSLPRDGPPGVQACRAGRTGGGAAGQRPWQAVGPLTPVQGRKPNPSSPHGPTNVFSVI